MKHLLTALVLVLVSTALAPLNAAAAGPVDLHTVNLKNSTVPGSTCHSHQPIKLHDGHGVGGLFAGRRLVDDVYGHPVYGDLTHDGNAEAMLSVLCSTGGGTAASDIKDNWVVFTGQSGKVRVLGVMTAKFQWLNTHPTVLGKPKIAKQVASVRETIYYPTDPDCCGTGRATTVWWFRDGALRIKSARLQVTDLIVGRGVVGHAHVNATVAQLRKRYGTLHSEALPTGCRAYWHGAAKDSFHAYVDPNGPPTAFGIFAPYGAVTRTGVGMYSTLAQIKHAYAGHLIKIIRQPHTATNVLVKYSHFWLEFLMTKPHGEEYVNSIMVGSYYFVTGGRNC